MNVTISHDFLEKIVLLQEGRITEDTKFYEDLR